MALARRCLDCSAITRRADGLCRPCYLRRQSARNARRSHLSGDYPARRRRLREESERSGAPCWLCGRPIAYLLPHPHPDSFTADHVDPGDPASELRPAHARCNSARGDRPA